MVIIINNNTGWFLKQDYWFLKMIFKNLDFCNKWKAYKLQFILIEYSFDNFVKFFVNFLLGYSVVVFYYYFVPTTSADFENFLRLY